MSCFAPLVRRVAEDGKVHLAAADAAVVDHSSDTWQTIPCGRCIGCRASTARQWRIRIMHEKLMHEASSFVTLTFDDEHYPPDGNLDVRTWQLFAKRLRKELGPFRFLQVGEYGESHTMRPHHHAILFGHDFRFDRRFHTRNGSGDRLFVSPALQDIWGKGHCLIGEVTEESAGYCAAYATKKLYGELGRCTYRRVDPLTAEVSELKPPFITMSRRPGLGHSFYERYGPEVYREDDVIERGKRVPPPKYYDRLLEKEDPEKFAEIKAARIRKAEERPLEKRSRKFLKGQERIKARRLAKSLRELRSPTHEGF